MKLKTLKDLKGWRNYCNGIFEEDLIEQEIIKQEAIKWVKNRNIKIDSDFCEFHNITEEDLK